MYKKISLRNWLGISTKILNEDGSEFMVSVKINKESRKPEGMYPAKVRKKCAVAVCEDKEALMYKAEYNQAGDLMLRELRPEDLNQPADIILFNGEGIDSVTLKEKI